MRWAGDGGKHNERFAMKLPDDAKIEELLPMYVVMQGGLVVWPFDANHTATEAEARSWLPAFQGGLVTSCNLVMIHNQGKTPTNNQQDLL